MGSTAVNGTEGIEVAAGVDRAVHASGLFGRHISERARDQLGWCGHLPLARQTRCDAEAGELDLSGHAVNQDIGRLDILVDEAAPMDLREGRGDRYRDAQKARQLHGRAEQSVQRLAVGVLEHQHDPAALADEFKRSRRPRPIQLVLQSVFASEAIEGGRCRMLRGGQHSEHSGLIAVGLVFPSTDVVVPSTEDAFAVLPQDLEAAISTSPEPRRWVHLRYPPPDRWPPSE
jgi:hypothetical protein